MGEREGERARESCVVREGVMERVREFTHYCAQHTCARVDHVCKFITHYGTDTRDTSPAPPSIARPGSRNGKKYEPERICRIKIKINEPGGEAGERGRDGGGGKGDRERVQGKGGGGGEVKVGAGVSKRRGL
jgi:hypothetical protein